MKPNGRALRVIDSGGARPAAKETYPYEKDGGSPEYTTGSSLLALGTMEVELKA